MFDSSAD